MTVTVDSDFVRFGSKSYAINKINSVEVRERKPYGRAGAVVWFILAAFFLLGGLGAVLSKQSDMVWMLGLGALFAFLGYRSWQKAKIREFLLFLMTSSSEAQAFKTRDADEVSTLRDEIETAMSYQARLGTAHS